VVQQKDELVAALRQGKYVDVAAVYPTITILKGGATLLGGRQVRVNDTVYEPEKIVVATGSSPWAPPIPGLQEAGFLTSEQALSLEALPASLIVIGGGSIGLEFAQLFTRFGVKVMVLESGPHVARAEEPEIGHTLVRYLEDDKVRICTNVRRRCAILS
jgi:mercuric reductase